MEEGLKAPRLFRSETKRMKAVDNLRVGVDRPGFSPDESTCCRVFAFI